MPSISRNAVDTDVPIMPPILLKEPNLELMADAVAATIIDVTTTILVFGDVSEKIEIGMNSEIFNQRKKTASVRRVA